MVKTNVLAAALLAALCLIACAGGLPGPNNAPPPTSIPFIAPPGGGQTSAAPTPAIPARTPTDLGLSGRLLYVQGQAGVKLFDLATSKITDVFQPPKDGLVSAASVSPDGRWIVMSYSPPPDPNKPQLGYTRLFIMPADGSTAPEPLLQPDDETGLLYSHPSWSADGKWIFFGYFSPKDTGDRSTGFSLWRVAYPNGHPEKVLDNGFQPRLSADGSKLAYVGLTDPTTPINELYVANADGSKPTRLVPNDSRLWTIDAPTFSPDGKSIVFSGLTNQPPTSTTWLDRLFGVEVASAHNVPSDLWKVPSAGGDPVNLAHVSDLGMYPAFSRDGEHIAYLSLNGIFVMNPDGSQLAQISILGGVGTLEWLK